MASKIRLLDDLTINQIAAGEVIESPASAVKELVDNAIDSGATAITVEIRAGGRQLIRVTDDGEGMVRDDAVMALERHATSKIRSGDTLNAINTLGFRGEALASIASISKMTLLTRPAGVADTSGTLVSVEGGVIRQCTPAARAQGTTIEVKALFYNVPARRKFQQNPSREEAEIIRTLRALTLAQPHVRITCVSKGAVVLRAEAMLGTSPAANFQERCRELLGLSFVEQSLPFSWKGESLEIYGWLGQLQHHRPRRTAQHLFINGRPIHCPLIAEAVREGYGSSLPSGRHPLFALSCWVPQKLIDVNVHPRKLEVRLRREESIREAVREAISTAITPEPLQPIVRTPLFAAQEPTAPPVSRPLSSPRPPPLKTYTKQPIKRQHHDQPHLEPQTSVETPLPFEKAAPLPTIVATLPGYALIRLEQTLYLIHQQRAHRAILYHSLRHKEAAKKEWIPFLIPLQLTLSTEEASHVAEQENQLLLWGIQARQTAPTTITVEAATVGWTEEKIEQLIHASASKDQLHTEATGETKERQLKWLNRFALDQNKRLSEQEALQLVKQLDTPSEEMRDPFGELICQPLDGKTCKRLLP